ncbi:transposase [Candidatus Bathyarchaeota archaeon]|nr:transposase [Candidatus Bathyarchaeota archaeon]
MMRTYKYRLYPSRQQEYLMSSAVETCRILYNNLLAERKVNYTNYYEQKRSVTEKRKHSKYLKNVHSQVLQDVVLRLDKAYQAYYTRLHRMPAFKRKERYNSFTYPQLGGFRLVERCLRLSMIGAIRVRMHRRIEGEPRTCTIVRDIDQWYACISTEADPEKEHGEARPAVGVDLGVQTLATLSDGRAFPNLKTLPRSVEKIMVLQRSISRKKEDSRNRSKAKTGLAKAWRKVRRKRDDVAQKVSHRLAEDYGIIVFEDLRIGNMVKNHGLASAILDATWGKLRQLTAYKAERRGGRVILVEPSGTSQACSGCGETVRKDLSVRIHICPCCGLVLGRDLNAARNILARGLERARAETGPLLVPVVRISKFRRGGEKPASFRSR